MNYFAKTLLYSEVPSYSVWKKITPLRRKQEMDVNGYTAVKKNHILYTFDPKNTKYFHLHLLLHEF